MPKLLNLVSGTALAALATLVSASARPVTLEVVHAWGGHARFHVPVAEAFMAQNPDVTIVFRAPMASYTDGHQTILRQALSNNLPDVWYSPYNTLSELVGALQPRDQIVPLSSFLEAEGQEWIEANYSSEILSLGQVRGEQWGIPFNASTPIFYYNLDLVEQAGGDVNDLPDTWDEMIALGVAISALAEDIDGLAYSVSRWGGDWLWQALVYSHGGTLMNEDKTQVTFGDEAGQQAISLAARLASETGMPLLTEEQTIQQFAAGKLGIFVGSTAEVRSMGDLVGDNFSWKTGPHPIAVPGGGLPTGGNVATILTQDAAKQQVAWEFIKFATGPEGQKITVLGSGYMPTNLRTTEPTYLGDYYRDNPDWTTSMRQWPVARVWFGYPGTKGTEIWREQQNILDRVLRGDMSPEDGLVAMVNVTEQLVNE